MRLKFLRRRLLVPLAGVGLLAITILIKAYLFQRQRCHIVYEKANHLGMKTEEQNDKTEDISNNDNNSIPLLTVSKDITIGPDEWISRTILDSKRECAASLESEEKDKKSDLACEIPDIDPFHPSMMKLLHNVTMPSCSQYKSYGKLVNGKIQFLGKFNRLSTEYTFLDVAKNQHVMENGRVDLSSEKLAESLSRFVESDDSRHCELNIESSLNAVNILYSHFCYKKNKLKWAGSLEDLKAVVLTVVDEQTAETTTWRSPGGGTWKFDSKALCVTWQTKSQNIYFEGENGEEVTKRIIFALKPRRARFVESIFSRN
ncbi:Hypothetical predicted protein [Paramuricea clavata]|uniref:Uncharacterized protein n=1 Tax=Paramuricea clavata TaxID=317549 RepID=A0A6S7JNL4_PARCT|nr:Hypothetical predicted protein [Paramuricea clavata]